MAGRKSDLKPLALILIVFILFMPFIRRPEYSVSTEAVFSDLPVLSGLLKPPAFSKTVDILPWDFDAGFMACQSQNGTHVMLGAYCAVLKDPLPGEEYNVHLAAAMLSGITIQPGGIFSQNGSLGPYTEGRGFREGPTYSGAKLIKTIGGGVCKIASALYNVAILSGMEIIERYCHSMPVPYVPYGQDATVSYGAKDFKFMNNSEDPVMIWAEGVENRLYIAFYGSATPPRVKWEHEVITTIKAPTVYQINSALAHDECRVILEGMDGAVVRSRIRVLCNDGSEFMRELGISSYNPMPHIIESGSAGCDRQ